jgi:hypothetical protein
MVMVICVACGQQGSDPAYDDAMPPSGGMGALASATVIDRTIGSVTVPIPPTRSGDKLVVILRGTGTGANSVVADTTPLELTLGGMTPDVCGGWAWAWLSAALPEGIDSLVINVPPGSSVAGYALAFSGLLPTFYPDAWEFAFTRGSTSAPVGPALKAWRGNVLVSAVGTCGSVGGLAPTSPFIALPSVDGSDVAYFIPSEPGAYGAEWNDTGTGWVVASLVFRSVTLE